MTALAVASQRERGLARANAVRKDRAHIKRQIAAGDMTVPHLLADIPECCERWPVSDMLMCQKSRGRYRTLKLLRHLKIGELRPVGQLTGTERVALAEAIAKGPAR